MSGICGYFDLRQRDALNKQSAEKMLKAIAHRGPAGSAVISAGGAVLGFNALSASDLAGASFDFGEASFPRDSPDKRISLVMDGRIFNAPELKKELETRGRVFKTDFQTELAVNLYLEYGDSFAERINGQFAIALHDGRDGSLLLIRDHVGCAPMFYAAIDGTLVFASEIKAILEYPGSERKLNLKALDQLLNYPGAVSPETFFSGVYSLKPGHMLKLMPGREPQESEYWDVGFPSEEEDRGEEYYVRNMRELLKKAIERRISEDMTTGFYLSGGLDSSTVACFISEFGLNSRYSFSAEIASGDLNESRFQQAVLAKTGSSHLSVKVDEEDIWQHLSDAIYHAESAVKESYDVAAFMLSGLVRQTPALAVLTGQGSDEFLCGYVGYMLDSFRAMQRAQMSMEECEVNERLWGDPYFRYERIHPEIRKLHTALYSKELRGDIESFSAFAKSPVNTEKLRGLSSQKRRSYIDSKLRLADHLLIEHGDSMTAAHSVEGRHPFLDKDLLAFILAMPDKYKLKGTNEKYVLKQAGKGIVPEEILKRRKFPFQAPGMSAMLKRLPSSEGAADMLSESLIRKYGIFDPEFINRLKTMYAKEDFQLMGAYEIDYLLIALSLTMLCERYGLSL